MTVVNTPTWAGALAVIMASSLASGIHAQEVSLEQLEELARQEGQVLWYTTVPALGSQAVADGFMERYPEITVEVQRLGAFGLWERLSAEHAAGRYTADVYSQADFGIRTQAVGRGIITQFVPTTAESLPPQFVDPDEYGYSNRLTCVAIAYNTNLVSPDQAPQTWNDLLDPQWMDRKIGMTDARSTGIGYASAWQLADSLGEEFLEKLAEQNPLQYEDSGQMANSLAAGEYPIMILPEYRAWDLMERGAPLAVTYPEDGIPCSVDFTHLVANAPHPNAAKLFMHYYATAEAADLLASGLMTYSVVPGIPPYPLGSGRPAVEDITLFDYDIMEQTADYDRFTQWYDEIFG